MTHSKDLWDSYAQDYIKQVIAEALRDTVVENAYCVAMREMIYSTIPAPDSNPQQIIPR